MTPLLVLVPRQPGDLVVQAVGVVVAALGTAALVAGREHGHAGRQQQGGQQVGRLAVSQAHDVGVVGLTLDPTVPRSVVIGAVAVVVAVRLVVLLLVRHQVAQGEAVVGGDEVDGRERQPVVIAVQVAGSGQPRGEVPHPVAATPPEVADRVAVLVVPLAPRRREQADQVALARHVPRLGDQLDVAQHRILVHGEQERRPQVDDRTDPAQRGCQVETEAVDVHLGHPVAQRVHHELQHLALRDLDRVAAAGDVEVAAVAAAEVVARVAEAAEGERRARSGLPSAVWL